MLDPSIPLKAQVAQIQSPYEALGQLAQLQQMRDATEARRIAGEEARSKALEAAAKRQRQAQIDAAIDAAYSGPPDPQTGRPTLDRSKLRAHLPGHLQYEVDQQLQEDEKTGLEFANAKLDRSTKQLDLDTKRRAFLGSQLRTIRAANYDPQLWAIEIRAAQRSGALDDENADRLIGITDPTQIKALTDQYIAQAGGEALKPPTVGSVEDYVTRYAASLGKAPEALTPADITTAIGQFQAANRAPAATPAPPAVGSFEDYVLRRFGPKPTFAQITAARKDYQQADDRPGATEPSLMQVSKIDPTTGEIVTELVPRVPGEVSRRPAPEPTKAQYDAGLFAGRLAQADPILTKLESAITGMNVVSYEFQLKAKPTFQSADMQSYMQAARNFINAVLRRESGAVISPEEFAEARSQYLPQPGDTAETLAQKKANRDYVSQSLRQQAGPAYQAPLTPPPPRPSDPLTLTLPDGTTWRFQNAAALAAYKRRAGLP